MLHQLRRQNASAVKRAFAAQQRWHLRKYVSSVQFLFPCCKRVALKRVVLLRCLALGTNMVLTNGRPRAMDTRNGAKSFVVSRDDGADACKVLPKSCLRCQRFQVSPVVMTLRRQPLVIRVELLTASNNNGNIGLNNVMINYLFQTFHVATLHQSTSR